MKRASISVCVIAILLAIGACNKKEKENLQIQLSKDYKTIIIQDSYLIGKDTIAILTRGTAKGLRLALSTEKGKAIFKKLNKAYINDEAIDVSTFVGTDLISDVNYQATANSQKRSINKPPNTVTRRVGLQVRHAFITYADRLPR